MEKFDQLLREATSHGTGGVAAAIAVVLSKDGANDSKGTLEAGGLKPLHLIALGSKDNSSNETVDLNSAFWGFSCTKLITTICALQCVERGLIGLDDPVSPFLKQLQSPQVISKADDVQGFTLRPAKRSITLRHLLSHTSGISYDAMQPLLMQWRQSRGEGPLVMSGEVQNAYSLPLMFDPGDGWTYGGSVDWAGILVERLNSGMTLGEYMERNVFAPLHAVDATFGPDFKPTTQAHLMQMYARNAEGTLVPTTSPLTPSTEHSGGMGLVLSVADLSKVLQDLLRDEPTLLSKASVDLMFTAQFERGSPQQQGLLAQDYLHSQLTGDQSHQANVAYGLGGMVLLKDQPNLPAGTLTWNGMPNIGWFLHRGRGLGGLYVSQILPASDPKSVELLGAFEREAWEVFGNSVAAPQRGERQQSMAGRTAVISGSSKGIGAGVARELSARGANLVLNYPYASVKEEALQVGERLATPWIAVCADLSTVDGPTELVRQAVDRFGKIDILISNAGYVPLARVWDAEPDSWDRAMDLNARGAFLLVKAALPHLTPYKPKTPISPHGALNGSRIVIIGSAASRYAKEDQGVYAATKGALDSMARVWAKELPPKYGCTVNLVAPGPVLTETFAENIKEHREEAMEMFSASTPVEGAFASVEDVAWAVGFLAEEESRFINGLYLNVSGGTYL